MSTFQAPHHQQQLVSPLRTRTKTKQIFKEEERAVCDAPALMRELKSCSMRRDLQRGRQIHAKAVASGSGSNIYVQSSLVKMYAKCGSMVDARRVFDSIQNPDVVSWNALLLGYADNGEGSAALDLFSRMKMRGFAPDSVTYLAAVKACMSLAENPAGDMADCLRLCGEIHSQIGSQMNHYVQTALVDMYSKCGCMVNARQVFDRIQNPDVVAWTALLSGYAGNGEGPIALDLFSRMKAAGCAPNSLTYIAALKACTSLALKGDVSRGICLERGRQIHSEVGCHLNRYVQNALVDMYSKCGSMAEARRVFDSMQNPDVVSWNVLLLGYAGNGEGHKALDLFSRMKARGFAPDSVTYTAALKACTSLALKRGVRTEDCLELGRQIHSEIGQLLDRHLQSTLIDMYCKFGSMSEARRVFDRIENPGVVSFTALVLGYAETGEGTAALGLFSRMKARGISPDAVAYAAALKACALLAGKAGGSKRDCLERGRQIHLEIGCHSNLRLQNALIDMYAKCGSMVEARRVFDGIQNPGVVSWNALLLGYAEKGQGQVAVDLFSRMKAGGCAPNSVTYVAALKACAWIGDLNFGRRLQSEIVDFTTPVLTCLVAAYAKCGSMAEARQVFDLHPRARDVSTWTALLAGYARFGDTVSAFSLFQAMQDSGFPPNAVTFVCLLSCCSHAGRVEEARECFEAMGVRYGVTPTVTHYTCMIDVLARANQLGEAIAMLRRMRCRPDAVTWTVLLGACRKWKNVEMGRLAFRALVDMDERSASAYVLMSCASLHGQEQTNLGY